MVSGDHVPQFVRADLVGLLLRVDPGEADDQVAGGAEQPHRRPGEAGQHVQRAGHQQRPPFGALHRDPFRGQLTEDQGDEGQRQGHHHDGHRLGGTAEEIEQRHQRLGQRDRRGGRSQEAGQGDADLDRGQEPVRVLGQPGEHLPGPAGAFQSLKLAVPQRDQGHLAAREDRVEDHQDSDQGQLAPVALHARHSPSAGHRSTDRRHRAANPPGVAALCPVRRSPWILPRPCCGPAAPRLTRPRATDPRRRAGRSGALGHRRQAEHVPVAVGAEAEPLVIGGDHAGRADHATESPVGEETATPVDELTGGEVAEPPGDIVQVDLRDSVRPRRATAPPRPVRRRAAPGTPRSPRRATASGSRG